MLFEEFLNKKLLGSGRSAVVYPSVTHTDRVIKKYQAREEMLDIIKEIQENDPQILPKIYSIDFDRQIVVMERVKILTTKDVVEMSQFLDLTKLDTGGFDPVVHDAVIRSDILVSFCLASDHNIEEDFEEVLEQSVQATEKELKFWMDSRRLCQTVERYLEEPVDFKEENISYTNDGRLVLVDF